MNPDDVKPVDVYVKVLEQMQATSDRDAAMSTKLDALTVAVDRMTFSIYVIAAIVFVKLLIHVVIFLRNNRTLNRIDRSLTVVEGHARVNKSERVEVANAQVQANKLIDAGSAMAATAAKAIERAINGGAHKINGPAGAEKGPCP